MLCATMFYSRDFGWCCAALTRRSFVQLLYVFLLFGRHAREPQDVETQYFFFKRLAHALACQSLDLVFKRGGHVRQYTTNLYA